ncbi:MAG: anhydro-N-acetylmuramic acid kinase [Planctomycetota bacterium]
MDRLAALRQQPERFVLGLNAGTSQDGIDAALLRFDGGNYGDPFEQVAFRTFPFSDRLKDRLRGMLSWNLADTCEMNVQIGEAFADAALALIEELPGRRADLIGSHGLTAWHRPPRRPYETGATLQLGELSVLSERLSVPVVGDFRSADVAAGGQGAPLTAFLDQLLFFRRPGTVALNLGGIANLTCVAAEAEDTLAFDTGPANLPLDQLAQKLSRGECSYDPEGRFAASGHIDEILLGRLLAHPFLLASPPKTTGREEFGEDFVNKLLNDYRHLKLVDIIATLTVFVARSVRRACAEFLDEIPLREVVVSGGGVENLFLMEHLSRAFYPIPVARFAEAGADAHSKEAMLFAVLAHERLFDRPGNLAAATGARWPVRLGKIC